jgi:hypothetical protein
MAVTINGSGVVTGIASGNAGFGKILQVVSTLKQDVFTTASTSYVDVTGLSASITPSSTSNLVLVMVSLALLNSASGTASRGVILRGATIIGGGTPAGSRPAGSFMSRTVTSSLADGSNPKQMTVLDSPASVSALTYKVQIAAESDTALVNRGAMNDNDAAGFPRLASSITLMEVSA